jgi:hypothetical protein
MWLIIVVLALAAAICCCVVAILMQDEWILLRFGLRWRTGRYHRRSRAAQDPWLKKPAITAGNAQPQLL